MGIGGLIIMSKKIIVLQAMPGNYYRPLEEQKSMLKSMREDIDKTGIVIIPKDSHIQ